jgi:hypothetical protein
MKYLTIKNSLNLLFVILFTSTMNLIFSQYKGNLNNSDFEIYKYELKFIINVNNNLDIITTGDIDYLGAFHKDKINLEISKINLKELLEQNMVIHKLKLIEFSYIKPFLDFRYNFTSNQIVTNEKITKVINEIMKIKTSNINNVTEILEEKILIRTKISCAPFPRNTETEKWFSSIVTGFKEASMWENNCVESIINSKAIKILKYDVIKNYEFILTPISAPRGELRVNYINLSIGSILMSIMLILLFEIIKSIKTPILNGKKK